MKMKYLNKIIFINSANIPYAEISIDGNVHFTGTQGVGKSTLLRALLFFYNADKHRLGIQQGQKSFDEFYFRGTCLSLEEFDKTGLVCELTVDEDRVHYKYKNTFVKRCLANSGDALEMKCYCEALSMKEKGKPYFNDC